MISFLCLPRESGNYWLSAKTQYCASLIGTRRQTSKCCPLIWPLKKSFPPNLFNLCVVPQTTHTRIFIAAQRLSTELFQALFMYSWGPFANSDSKCTLAQTGQFLNWECCRNIPFIQSTALFEWPSAVWAVCSVWGDGAAKCRDCGPMGELTEMSNLFSCEHCYSQTPDLNLSSLHEECTLPAELYWSSNLHQVG